MSRLSDQRKRDAMRMEVEIMEKEILYLKGRRERKKGYFKLLKACGGTCGLDDARAHQFISAEISDKHTFAVFSSS
jgi:hypothetical protein